MLRSVLGIWIRPRTIVPRSSDKVSGVAVADMVDQGQSQSQTTSQASGRSKSDLEADESQSNAQSTSADAVGASEGSSSTEKQANENGKSDAPVTPHASDAQFENEVSSVEVETFISHLMENVEQKITENVDSKRSLKVLGLPSSSIDHPMEDEIGTGDGDTTETAAAGGNMQPSEQESSPCASGDAHKSVRFSKSQSPRHTVKLETAELVSQQAANLRSILKNKGRAGQ